MCAVTFPAMGTQTVEYGNHCEIQHPMSAIHNTNDTKDESIWEYTKQESATCPILITSLKFISFYQSELKHDNGVLILKQILEH